MSFNTASGKYCCNLKPNIYQDTKLPVSIPQAVSTVATGYQLPIMKLRSIVSIPQAVSTVATYCS